MTETTMHFDTPLPGHRISEQESIQLIDAFLKRYRKTGPKIVSYNFPTACLLRGRKDPNYLTSPNFLARESVLFYVDGTRLLHRTTPSEVIKYFSSVEPWETFDICLFDEGLEWCVGITHNGHIIVVDD